MTQEKSEKVKESSPFSSILKGRFRSQSESSKLRIKLPENSQHSERSPKESPRFSPRIFSPRSKAKSYSTFVTNSPRIIYEGKELPFSSEKFFLISQSILKNDDGINDSPGDVGEYTDENGNLYNIFITASDGGTHFLLLDWSNKLGAGGTASVFMAYDLLSGDKIAAKIFNSTADRRAINTEIENLKIMGWLFGKSEIKEQTAVFMQYAKGENLLDFLYKKDAKFSKESSDYYLEKKSLSYHCKIRLSRLFLEHLNEIHQKGLIHRDIKTDNMLLQVENGDDIQGVRIIDVGNAISVKLNSKLYSSSFFYAPPEVCKVGKADTRKFYSCKSDLFSAGVVLAEIFTKKNVQVGYRKKLAKMIKADEMRDLTPQEIYEVMPDIFSSHSLKKVDTLIDSESIDKYLYQAIAEKTMKALIKSFTSPDPKQRLMHSSLEKEIKILEGLELEFLQTKKAIISLLEIKKEIKDLGLNIFQLLERMETKDVCSSLRSTPF